MRSHLRPARQRASGSIDAESGYVIITAKEAWRHADNGVRPLFDRIIGREGKATFRSVSCITRDEEGGGYLLHFGSGQEQQVRPVFILYAHPEAFK
ncbi:MAG: hypothetical protein ACTHKB_00720 [Burkholderiaceae bacterium]